MQFDLEPLPFEKDALAPYIGAKTVEIHYEKHHGGYISKLDAALDDEETRAQSLTDIMLNSDGTVFNLAAQVWNHNFYWQSLTPEAQTLDDEMLSTLLNDSFGGLETFNKQFAETAAGQFGSGWAWLVFDPDEQRLNITSTSDADNPLLDGQIPLLTLDVWEHAYYLDYKNDRASYIDGFLSGHINWSFAQQNLTTATKRAPL
ncbi:MAG: superoxide dismutase [Pseudomonadaceae bacterium]|nr:superoxide dismutase [Pseudomonadaceae bacterium]